MNDSYVLLSERDGRFYRLTTYLSAIRRNKLERH